MNRQRKMNRGLPRRVYIKFNAYYYVSPVKIRDPKTKEMKTWIRLCGVDDGEVAMLNALATFLGSKTHVEGTMPHLCAEFKAKKLGKYSKQTQDDYTSSKTSEIYIKEAIPDVSAIDMSLPWGGATLPGGHPS